MVDHDTPKNESVQEWEDEDPLVRFVAILLHAHISPWELGMALQKATGEHGLEALRDPYDTQLALVPVARDLVDRFDVARHDKDES